MPKKRSISSVSSTTSSPAAVASSPMESMRIDLADDEHSLPPTIQQQTPTTEKASSSGNQNMLSLKDVFPLKQRDFDNFEKVLTCAIW